MSRFKILTAVSVSIITTMSICQNAEARNSENSNFRRWVNSVWPEARRNGVSKSTFNTAFKSITPNWNIIKSVNNQPEFVKPIWEYLDRAVSDTRISNGRKRMQEYSKQLSVIQNRYGVDRHIVAAIWGMESAYGASKGKLNVIRSLATLGYRGKRKKFGRTQLLAALKILQSGDIPAKYMTGSWAGAMGHTQFIPTTYLKYAVDYTGDGTRDIWRSASDAMASTANYLKASGWQRGKRWGYEVKVPRNFNYTKSGLSLRKPAYYWKKMRIKRADGGKISYKNDNAALIFPAGARGPAFLVFQNFRAIMRYNNSVAYALAVGHLGDRLRGDRSFYQSWPRSDTPLRISQRKEIQRRLNSRGYKAGKVDGIIGSSTVEAIKKYQNRVGMTPDGYPSQKLLQSLKKR